MTEPSLPPGAGERKSFMGFPEPEGPAGRIKMAIGLLGGIAVSAVVWGLFFDKMTPTLIAVVIGGKLVIAVATIFHRDWRPLGQGLLASIAIGALIFVWKLCSGIGG